VSKRVSFFINWWLLIKYIKMKQIILIRGIVLGFNKLRKFYNPNFTMEYLLLS